MDELGFVPLSRAGSELLFELSNQRYERGSIIVTTNFVNGAEKVGHWGGGMVYH